ncbi:4-hydroxy-3-polyprenylbenzoate decarboxylase [Geoalkalibacter ferrihydriticus]|uniref:Flavin prenyltransferase UbiX n=2 Tax=Geoalkalibacter ferrihydriticus TaxID=392333 RepID=A0A0C2HS01_9BACT|nr:flavin prenyltransferase UbiX [Geoalkalibacter ferrihydriticus]KIH77600.1 aromatic acid decarboxylase [Geoalkalibacter ferrihydriticus DSM 17813]SDL69830.1 4-hydroxy-3-polyprenylbenzoate decarboxylase [Geoalkalibacter ferrihydriticus]
MTHILVAITGASGSIYGLRLVEELLRAKYRVTLLVTRAGMDVLRYETGLKWSGTTSERQVLMRDYFDGNQSLLHYDADDLFAPVASGSSAPDAMVVAPCSMGSAARMAAGISDNLVERVADVMLKERRELVLVPRETPFNQLHLENLLRLARAGAHILPAMPAFYQRPQTMEDLIDFVVGKILDSLRLEHKLFERWGEG